MPVDAMAFLRPYKREIPGKPSGSTPSATPKATPPPQKRPRPPPKDDDDDLAKPRPKGSYTEFKLISTSRDNWKYDIFKFDSRKPVNLGDWPQPLKLNRKNPAPRDGEDVVSKGPITPMLGLDGKPVIGPDGNFVMMQDGRPVKREEVKKEEDDVEEGSSSAKPKEPAPKKRKPFQKKTRQIHTIPEEQRQLQREERYPWVLEDQSGQETWVGRIENAEKSSMYGLFLTSTSTEFYFIPAHRWYKMQKRPNTKTATMEEVEAEYARLQKNHTLEFWRKRQQQSIQAVAAAEAEGRPINLGHIPHQPSLVRSFAGTSMAAGGRRLKMVDKGAQSLFGDDDEEEVKDKLKKRRDRELGEEGDLDEIEFEDDFADDDEKMNVDGEDDDEEAKELEERIKRETRAANKLRQAGVDEDESEEEDFLKDLTGAGKDVKKALRTFEKNAAYDSDDDKNPYLTSEDEEEEEVPPTPQATGPDASSTAPPAKSGSKPSQKEKGTSKPHANGKSRPSSRATSPTAPGTGSSLLAHRATSPKGKGANGSASRASSPKMSGGSGRPMSPTHPGSPRAASPLANGSGSRATSPAAHPSAAGASKKRKAEDLSSPALGGSGQPAVKKVKKTAPSGAAPPPGRQIDEALVVEWLRVQSKPPTTMECISKFRAYLVDKNAKIILTNIIKKVAELKGGVLTLKPGF